MSWLLEAAGVLAGQVSPALLRFTEVWMAFEEVLLTRTGYNRLKDELHRLKSVRRVELAEELRRAGSRGDLNENAEFQTAREAQLELAKRIEELEMALARAKIIDDMKIPRGKAYIGATVLIKDTASGEETSYTLVGAYEADLSKNCISVHSPLAKALLGHVVGDVVRIEAPGGTHACKILQITRS